LLSAGDVVIDGGNTLYRDTQRRIDSLEGTGILFVGAGVSGGEEGALHGPALMPGGSPEAWPLVRPFLQAIAAKADDGQACCEWMGPGGAGHFVKMVHNGIEYALMASYSEGLNILKHANVGKVSRDSDAETAPMANPEFYQYDLDVPAITELWRRGSVVGSWLLDLTALALSKSPELDEFSGRVSDSGEGRWTAIASIEEGVPTPVLTAALQERFYSQGSSLFSEKILSAMRKEFGGHDEKK
jgi:6-phosphogluconate dehydrogenase